MGVRFNHLYPTAEEAFPPGFGLRRASSPPQPVVVIKFPPSKQLIEPPHKPPTEAELRRLRHMEREKTISRSLEDERAKLVDAKAYVESMIASWEARSGSKFTEPMQGDLARAKAIVAETRMKHGISEIDFTSRRRIDTIIKCRHEAAWRLKQETRWSLPRIARFMGGFDHTTILHGIRRHQERLDRGEARS